MTRRLRAELGRSDLRDFPELRGSHRRILQMIPADGIRITDLARLAGMTKQSLGEFVGLAGAGRGFVASGRDPADGRVRLVTRTAQGDTAADTARQAIAAVERAWRQEIGASASTTR